MLSGIKKNQCGFSSMTCITLTKSLFISKMTIIGPKTLSHLAMVVVARVVQDDVIKGVNRGDDVVVERSQGVDLTFDIYEEVELFLGLLLVF